MKNLIVILMMFLAISCSKNNSNVTQSFESNDNFIGEWGTNVNGQMVDFCKISQIGNSFENYNIKYHTFINENGVLFTKKDKNKISCYEDSDVLIFNEENNTLILTFKIQKNKQITLIKMN